MQIGVSAQTDPKIMFQITFVGDTAGFIKLEQWNKR